MPLCLRLVKEASKYKAELMTETRGSMWTSGSCSKPETGRQKQNSSVCHGLSWVGGNPLFCHHVSPCLAGVISQKQPPPITQCPCPLSPDVRHRLCPKCHMHLRAGIRQSPGTRKGVLPPTQEFPVDIQCIQQEAELPLGQKSLCLSSSRRQNASIPIRTPIPAFQASPQSDISRLPLSLLFARLTLAGLNGSNIEVVLPQESHDPSNLCAPIQSECSPVVGPILPSSTPNTVLPVALCFTLNSNLHESRQYFAHF